MPPSLFVLRSYTYDNYGNRLTSSDGKSYTWERVSLLKSPGGGITYAYNHQGVRVRKLTNNVVTTAYYNDGTKLLGEDRGSNKLRYFYDATGICGFSYNGTQYTYVKDVLGSVVMIMNEFIPVARYRYDGLGNCTVMNPNGTSNAGTSFIGNINPIRWKSHYYDTESGLYYIGGRYYDKEIGLYLDAEPMSSAIANATEPFGLDRNAPMCNNILELIPYMASIFTMYALATSPEYVIPNVSGEENDLGWLQGFLGWMQVLSGIALMFVPGGQVFGGTMIAVGLSNAFGSHIAGGIGSVMNGAGAIGTGISLLGFGPIGWIVGGALILIGAGTLAFGINEIGYGATGVNLMQDWGMSDEWYNGLYLGLNIASGVGQFAAPMVKRIASNQILNSIVHNPTKIKNYSITQIKKYGRYTSQFTQGVMQQGKHAGQGYTLTHNTGAGNGFIMWHPGGGHHGLNAYFKITAGGIFSGKLRYDTILKVFWDLPKLFY